MKSSRRFWATVGTCLLALAMVAVAADWTAPVYPQRDFSDLPIWEVAGVLGSDRIIIRQAQKQRTVKLLGIAHAVLDSDKAANSSYEPRAQEFLTNLLKGERVYVSRLSSDAGKITSVKLFRVPDGLYVNLELIRQGYSQLDRTTVADERKLFQIYQRRAQQVGKGLWAKRLSPTSARTFPGAATVYVTKSGKKYHRPQCQFLAKSKIAIKLSQAKKRSFTPCKVCKPSPK